MLKLLISRKRGRSPRTATLPTGFTFDSRGGHFVKIRLGDLWEKCVKCQGRGTSRSKPPKICTACDGQGGMPTENGRAIVELVKHVTRPRRRNT
jgi:DnaJ-class molecular chaperone